jgi:hypothetical protein
MQGIPSDSEANSTFTFDPMNKVVGVSDNVDNTRDALRDLIAAGFSEKEIALLTDEEAARQIGANDETREVSVHFFRSTQKLPALYDAPVIVRRLEQELLAGHHLIGVIAKDAETRERACGILKSHGGHFINFYGRWAAEALEP